MLRVTRRRALQLGCGVALAGITGGALRRQTQTTIRVGLIGCGMRGTQLAGLINNSAWSNVRGQIVAICDVDQIRAEQARAKYSPRAEITQDFRQVLNREDVDAVFIATPDHWHATSALAALNAGKHVYCEKPMTLTIAEGQQLVQATHATGLTFQVGTQQRSHRAFQTACDLVRHGRLGQLRKVEISVPLNRSGGPFPAQAVPATLDWDRWLGPAPHAEYCPERFGGFRFWYEYGGGTLADWGAHNIDIAQWAMGLDQSGPLEISGEAILPQIENGYSVPTQFAVEMRYANGVTLSVRPSSTDSGILFEGDEGRIHVNRRRITGKPFEQLGSSPLAADAARVGQPRTSAFNSYNDAHVLHFFDCIVTGQTPISDVASQHRSASACHLANIALRLGRTVRWNPACEEFANDPAASGMLYRTSRATHHRFAENVLSKAG